MSTKAKTITHTILKWFSAITVIGGLIWFWAVNDTRLYANERKDAREHAAISRRIDGLQASISNGVLLMVIMTNDLAYIRRGLDQIKK